MDHVMIEKLQAMKRYKKRSFLYRIMSFIISLLSLGLFLSSPLWVPKLYFFMRFFFLVCVPNAREIFLGPRCLFLVCNLIVVLLLRDSKGRGGASDIYEEYARRNKSVGRKDVMKEQKVKEEEQEEARSDACSDVEEILMDDIVEGDTEDEKEEDTEPEGDEENGIPPEELNKRIDDFIARFNKERWMEEKLLMYED